MQLGLWKKLNERKVENCPLVSPCRVGGRGSVLKGIADPLPLEFLKKKGNLLLAETVRVVVFPSWCLIEISCAIPSTDPGTEEGPSK